MSQNTENKQTESKEKKQLSILETIEAYAGGEKFPKRKITEEQEKEWTTFLEEQRKKDYGEKK